MFPVAIAGQSRNSYAQSPPFHFPRIFPESPFAMNVDETNEGYLSIIELFRLLKYDQANVATTAWNPLGWLIKPDETVFLRSARAEWVSDLIVQSLAQRIRI